MMPKTLHGKALYKLELVGKNLALFIDKLKVFSYSHSNFFSCFFLFLYSTEQGLLLILTDIFDNSIKLIISLFVVIAFLTFGVQKLFMESKNKYLEKKVSSLEHHNQYLTKQVEYLTKLVDEVWNSYKEVKTEDLKEKKPTKKYMKRGVINE